MNAKYDVVVVGAGNAAFSAAYAAIERVGRVLVLEIFFGFAAKIRQ